MKLPFEKKPFISSYHNKAFPLGVVQGNSKKSVIPGLISKYINFCFDKNSVDHWFDFFSYSPWWADEMVTSSQSIILDKKMYINLKIDIIHTIITLLDNGYYVHGSYNEKYIPQKKSYMLYDYIHDYILIGYDKKNSIFYSVGYLQDDKYQEFEIKFSDFLSSLYNNGKRTIEINTCRLINDPSSEPNYEWIIEELYDYIYSTNSKEWHNEDITFGLSAMKMLKEYLTYTVKRKYPINVKYVRLYMEHKKIMNIRLEYLSSIGVIHDQHISKAYAFLSKKSEALFNTCIKYNISRKTETLKTIESMMHEIYLFEKEKLPLVLKDIEEHVEAQHIAKEKGKKLEKLLSLKKEYSQIAFEAGLMGMKEEEKRYEPLLLSIDSEIKKLKK